MSTNDKTNVIMVLSIFLLLASWYVSILYPELQLTITNTVISVFGGLFSITNYYVGKDDNNNNNVGN